MSAYSELEAKAREVARLREVAAITHWDEACMMPLRSAGVPGHTDP